MDDFTGVETQLKLMGFSEEKVQESVNQCKSVLKTLDETFDQDLNKFLWKLESEEKYDGITPSQEDMDKVLSILIKKFIKYGSDIFVGLFKTDMVFIMKKFNWRVLTYWDKERVQEEFSRFILSKKIS